MLNHIGEYRTEYERDCYDITLEIADRVVDQAYDEVTEETVLELAQNYIAYVEGDAIVKEINLNRDERSKIFVVEMRLECR